MASSLMLICHSATLMHCCSAGVLCYTLAVLDTCCRVYRALCHCILHALLNTAVHFADLLCTAVQPIRKDCELWCRHVMRPPSSFRSPRRLERLSGLLHRSSTRRPPLPTRRPPRRPGTLPRRPEMRSARHCLCCCWPSGFDHAIFCSCAHQQPAFTRSWSVQCMYFM